MKAKQPILSSLGDCWQASALALICLSFQCFSQTLDAFNPNANKAVTCLVEQPDGRIIIGGVFTTLSAQTHNCIGRINADGTLDTLFNAGVTVLGTTVVSSLAVQTDGKLMVGGNFLFLNGQSRLYLGRLNRDGTLDNAFSLITGGGNAGVQAVVMQTDNKVLLGGGFILASGLNRTNIARFNTDGTLDTNFNAAANTVVNSLAVQTDGRILVGGQFTNLNGQPRNYIGRLNADGTLDDSFNPGTNGIVNCIAVQADGRILVGGTFTTLCAQPRNRIGRLNADGTLDASFNPGVSGGGTPPQVLSFGLQADQKILVGGWFGVLGGQSRTNIGRLSSVGTLDTSFNIGTRNIAVLALALQADGKLLLGGSFTNVAGQSRNYIARISNTDAATQNLILNESNITWLRGGTSPEVWRTSFESSSDGTNWSSLGEGTRIAGGWQLTNVSVFPNATIRARGVVSGGQNNGSCWFVESLSRPIILAGDSSFGVRSNQFGFNIAASLNQTIIVEGSSDSVDWFPLVTNTFSTAPFYFSDPEFGTVPLRLYRARQQ